MIPPKYRYFIGRQSVPRSVMAKYLEDNGQYTNTVNSFCIDKHSIASDANYLYLSLPYDAKRDSGTIANGVEDYSFSFKILAFDATNSVVARHICVKSTAIELPENAVSYSICGIFLKPDLRETISNWIESGIIYHAKSCIPHYKELSKKFSKENNQQFFRVSLEGKISIFKDNYSFVKNSSLNDQLGFFIQRLDLDENEWYEFYKGQFNKTDCILDYERKKCELKLTHLDSYSNIMDKYENTYDLIKLKPEITKINMYKRMLLQVYIKGADSITNFFGGTYWEDDVIEAIDSDDDLVKKYYFTYIKAANEFYINDCLGNSGVNGVYAGSNGVWNNCKGYTAYFATEDKDKLGWAYIEIKRDSDGAILYRSSEQHLNGKSGNYYIDREDIKMVSLTNSHDYFTIKSPFVYHIYQRILCDTDTALDIDKRIPTYDLPINDFVVDNRNYKKCIGLKSEGGNFFCTSKTVTTPTKYGINDFGEYFTDKFLESAAYERFLPISRNSWANASLWYAYGFVWYEYFERNMRKQYTLKDSYSIAAVIKALLSKIDPAIKHEATQEYSQFLYGSSNPLGTEKFYVYITQKTNILKGQYDQAAQKAEISLEDVMKMLRDCFRCYWYIEDNKLKIEHILFFMNGGSYDASSKPQLDFTNLKDQFNRKLTAYFQSEIEYDKSELNSRYEFNWMDDATELFGQVTIDVNAKYIQKDKKEEVNVSQFSSDVDFMLFNPSNFSNDGFALLCPVKNGSTYELPIVESKMVDEDGNKYSFIAQNWYASWPYLVQKYYMYDMPAYNIDINVFDEVYVSRIKKCMGHTIEFPIVESLDDIKLIETMFGPGNIDNYAVNINTNLVKAKLVYEPR